MRRSTSLLSTLLVLGSMVAATPGVAAQDTSPATTDEAPDNSPADHPMVSAWMNTSGGFAESTEIWDPSAPWDPAHG